MSYTINSARLSHRLDEINKIGKLPGGGVSRPSLSDEDKKARDLLISWIRELGLSVQIDQMGNIFSTWKGVHSKIIGTGSHLDTVPTGGYYDGALGICAGLEVIQTLIEKGYKPQHSITLANFTNEEGTRFTPDMMGSLGYANPDQVELLYQSKANDDQRTVLQELQRIGYHGPMKCGTLHFNKFIELHIEQGPILEEASIDIGVVEGVQAIHWKRLTLNGRSAHAGTTPINNRKDPFYALSMLSAFCRDLCQREKDLLITIGSVQLSPNVINVVPRKIVATIDLRHNNDKIVERSLAALANFIASDKSFSGISVEEEILVNIAAVKFNEGITKTIKSCCDKLGYSSRLMISGAGHDAQLLSNKYHSAMIFIPSRHGISHAVDEFSSPLQIEKGANVLLDTILELDIA